MISLDTNVLVRFFTQDDDEQYQKVVQLFVNLENTHAKAFIPMLVLLEVNWVLSHLYKIKRQEIIDNLLLLCETEFLVIENSNQVKNTLLLAKNNSFDLSDLLIACRCQVANNLPVMTFDKKASKYLNFELLA